jgi:uncharacterized phage protein (TIGR01671 family)
MKFRYWDIVLKSFVFSDEFDIVHNLSRLSAFFSKAALYAVDVQEWTGQKDSNQNDIYQGDIMKSSRGGIKEVIWYEPDSAWRLREPNNNVSMSFNGWVKSDCVVIGNIYQNPELLKNDDLS